MELDGENLLPIPSSSEDADFLCYLQGEISGRRAVMGRNGPEWCKIDRENAIDENDNILPPPTISHLDKRLKPCPFCGGTASMDFSVYELDRGFHATCLGHKSCPLYCSDPYRCFDTESQARIAWNTRESNLAKYRKIVDSSYKRPRSRKMRG